MHKKKRLTLIAAALLPVSAILHADETQANDQETGGAETVMETVTLTPDRPSSVERVEFAVAEERIETESNTTEGSQAVEGGLHAETESSAERESIADVTPKPESSAANDADVAAMDRWKEREQRYQALRKRAEEAGVMLPAQPPWQSVRNETFRPDMQERRARHQKMMNMSPEERDAYRLEHFQTMREQALSQGVQMPETPPWVARRQAMEDEWAKHQEVIEKMSPEERAACHAMHRRHMGYGAGYAQGCGGPGRCQGPYANPAAAPAPIYPGYAPASVPTPYGQGSFWDPNY